ncbi:MAG: cytochrome c oxidase subunit II [Chloroflexi bacterium]|nr:cytochrome c oxidase subunit II [Chloroflexota bacterium]
MPLLRASVTARPRLLGLSLAAIALVAGCASPQGTPQTTVFPMTEAGRMIQDLYVWIFWMSAIVFVAVQGGILYIVWRFRYRPDHPLPEQVHGNNRLEIMWTILPAIILVIIAFPTIFTLFSLDRDASAEPVRLQAFGFELWPRVQLGGVQVWPIGREPRPLSPGPPLPIEVIGHQWWWEYRYPEQGGLVSANELIVPTGRTIELKMRSDDVVHSFWVPQLMGKQDVMPAHVNTLWFAAEEPGQYFGQCAEYCGIQHAQMRMNVIAYSPADFQAWVARNQRPALPTTDLAQQGEQIFRGYPCVACHRIDGTSAQGTLAPDLSHFGSRTTIAAGILPNTPENLARWLRNPDEVKPGNHMANPPAHFNLGTLSRDYLNLRPSEVEALVEYLHSLK